MHYLINLNKIKKNKFKCHRLLKMLLPQVQEEQQLY